MMNKSGYTEIFHVHTARCKHATGTDRELIEACISTGANVVTFTDHAPFPENPFRNRMDYAELDNYINSLLKLKNEYKNQIGIHIGLETEYFPAFEEYYASLNRIHELDAGLLLGQHMYFQNGEYSFRFDKETLKREEFSGLGNAIIDGMKTGLFNRVAHPNRIFRRYRGWDDGCEVISNEIIKTSYEYNIPLELNMRSLEKRYHFDEFWKLVKLFDKDIPVFVGMDAHSVNQIKEGIHNFKCLNI